MNTRFKYCPVTTVLHKAAAESNARDIKWLLENNPILPDQEGNTPLHIAAQHNNLEVFKVLVESGANVDDKNAAGVVPIGLVPADSLQMEEFQKIHNFQLKQKALASLIEKKVCELGMIATTPEPVSTPLFSKLPSALVNTFRNLASQLPNSEAANKQKLETKLAAAQKLLAFGKDYTDLDSETEKAIVEDKELSVLYTEFKRYRS